MDEMQIDVKESGLIFGLAYYVRVPEFLKQSTRHRNRWILVLGLWSWVFELCTLNFELCTLNFVLSYVFLLSRIKVQSSKYKVQSSKSQDQSPKTLIPHDTRAEH